MKDKLEFGFLKINSNSYFIDILLIKINNIFFFQL